VPLTSVPVLAIERLPVYGTAECFGWVRVWRIGDPPLPLSTRFLRLRPLVPTVGRRVLFTRTCPSPWTRRKGIRPLAGFVFVYLGGGALFTKRTVYRESRRQTSVILIRFIIGWFLFFAATASLRQGPEVIPRGTAAVVVSEREGRF